MADKSDYPDPLIRRILGETRTIAMVGASTNWVRPSYFVMKYLQGKGYRVIPVNPRAAGKTLLGEKVEATLAAIGAPVDMVDVFRRPEACPDIARAAAEIGARVLWLQLGVISDEAREIAEAAGLTVIMDRCPKIEYARLNGEIGWNGINSRLIGSRRRKL